jgi:hypothetical protein
VTWPEGGAVDDKRFWDVIDAGCPDGTRPEEWGSSLVGVLKQLEPDEIVRFDRWFEDRADAAYCRELWSVASMLNGGASDDGFYYFRCWLVGMGKQVYEAALADPDSLAGVVDPDGEYEAEIYGVARGAWEAKGLPEVDFDAAYSAGSQRQGRLPLTGEWVRDEEAIRRRFPRLAALYLDEDEGDEDDSEGPDWLEEAHDAEYDEDDE